MLIKNSDFGPSGFGYLEVDNRACDLPPGVAARHFEADTYTCTHCERVVVLNPARKRERYKCRYCDHHICDDCAALAIQGTPCKPFKVVVEEIREQAERQAKSLLIHLP